jgi:hypothetical protein
MAPGAGRTARDDEASAPCARRRDITQPSSRITNTPAASSGADVGQFSHWPHLRGGASSSRTSTTATRSLVVGESAGDADVAAAIAVVATAAATAPCYSPVAIVVPRGGSPVAAALAAAHGALYERRLVSTAASDLSTLAGARAGTVGVTLRTRNTRVSIDPSKSRTHGGKTAHLKLEKPHFLFLEGSGGAAVALASTAVAPTGASAALASSSAKDPATGAFTPAAGSSVEDPATGAFTPAAGASSAAAPTARGDGGGGFHLSRRRGARPPLLPSSCSSSDVEFTGVVRGRPRCLRCRVLLVLLLSALLLSDSPLIRTRRPLLFPPLHRAGGRPGPRRR